MSAPAWNLCRWLLAAIALSSSPAMAHEASSSYLYWQDSRPQQLRLDIALIDLIANTSLKADSEGKLRWQNLLDAETQLAALIETEVSILNTTDRCPAKAELTGLSQHGGISFSVWHLTWPCQADGIRYRLFASDDALHRALVTAGFGDKTQLSVLSPANAQLNLRGEISRLDTLWRFIYQGMLHMWLGLDHVLFLLTLLMLVFYPRASGAAANVDSGHIRQLILVVTSFTLAHSITLVLSSLSLIQLSSTVVETLIAVSIVVGAIKVLLPRWRLNTLLISFGFGLLHGLGFAGVLADILAQTPSKLVALFGFNIGVELAQLSLVLAALPLLQRWQSKPRFMQLAFRGCSVAIALLGLVWSLQRSGVLQV